MEMDLVLTMVRQADDDEMDFIINAVTDRYKQIHPGWEIAFLSLPLHDKDERRRILEFTLKYGPRTLG